MGARVLIVDDSRVLRRVVARALTLSGVELSSIHEAGNGVEAPELLAAHPIDLVVADINMPQMTGVEFIRELKRINKDVVVMVITGYSDLASAVETLTLGAYDYIEKPVSIEKFGAALERGLEKRQLVAQLNFSKGMIWMIVISIPLWMILGIILSYFWKR